MKSLSNKLNNIKHTLQKMKREISNINISCLQSKKHPLQQLCLNQQLDTKKISKYYSQKLIKKNKTGN